MQTTTTTEWASDPRWPDVTVTLKDGSTRQGRLLVDRGATVIVEILTPAGFFRCRTLAASQVTR